MRISKQNNRRESLMHTSLSSVISRLPLLVLAGLQFAALVSCSDTGGGVASTGGVPATGGTVATGGTTGGTTGGVVSTGGIVGTGGASPTGGNVAAGGTTGGSLAMGGTPSTGGASGGSGGAGSSLGGSGSGGGGGGAGGSTAGAGGAKGGAGGTSGAGGAAGGAGGSGGASSTGFTLTSPNHAEGATFAAKYTCSEKGFQGSVMPELHWTAGPSGTKSYALTFIDTTLARKTPPDSKGFHWVLYNIPATVTSLPEALTDAQAKALPAKENSAFLGPCPNYGTAPPTGANTDNYEFTLYALATETVDISGSNIVMAADTKLEGSNLAKTKLTGKSNAANTK